MQPLLIRAWLSRPMRWPEMPIHLDAVLAWAAVREAEEQGREPAYDAQEELPLATDDGDGGPVWCASQFLIEPLAPPQQVLAVKRFELHELAVRRGTLITEDRKNQLSQGTGPFKSFVMKRDIVWTDTATAFAMGERPRIEELLRRVTSLGKHRSLCFGLVDRWEVVDDARAASLWRLRVMPRPVPGFDFVEVEATCRPPYWRREARRHAWMPLDPWAYVRGIADA